MLRVVIDANVWVSALLNPGKARQLVESFEHAQFVLFYPADLLVELRRIPTKSKLAQKIRMERIARLVTLIKKNAIRVELKNIEEICRDPDDDVFLACAKEANCDYLISGDKDLQDLKIYGHTKVVSPAEFLEVLEQEQLK